LASVGPPPVGVAGCRCTVTIVRTTPQKGRYVKNLLYLSFCRRPLLALSLFVETGYSYFYSGKSGSRSVFYRKKPTNSSRKSVAVQHCRITSKTKSAMGRSHIGNRQHYHHWTNYFYSGLLNALICRELPILKCKERRVKTFWRIGKSVRGARGDS